jgi:hypothetical protein
LLPIQEKKEETLPINMISLLNNDDTWNHTLLVVAVRETHMPPLFLHFQNFPVKFLGFQQFL